MPNCWGVIGSGPHSNNVGPNIENMRDLSQKKLVQKEKCHPRILNRHTNSIVGITWGDNY